MLALVCHPEADFWPKDLLLVQGFLKTEILRSAQDDSKIEVYATIASPEGRNLGLALVCHPEERVLRRRISGLIRG